ncbi:TPA: IdeS/Mac family cysteine endopeptidase [Streptococcus equi subsp. zooepidemicus]|nr:IdeS/Mac family cysteine endopeptidase [Streptococcus equi subsp. zooepidemicus]HEL1070382.1 IdeS/Mac family cysteine endopeptidase [Streptococcus equi subsp. zooepidemicus]HEL1136358.1 IdeS/Mac family cysteine endopeptidase [Streptococcus equi subsp. zooepidemicus]HEL1254461.1 IdeS/Mac family cysteine endopeptidase [Streptococcus equi subsp. zooepidemicus]HEL1276388.1 IdeS/Mac family cysteine endopeptidase [Streptococcus equi subsp. zooepidemicus]
MKKQSFTHSRKPKFGMRKLSIGLASCMLGMMFLTTGHVNADDVDSEGGTLMLVPEQRGNWYSYRSDIEDFQADKTKEHVMYTKWLDGVTVDDSQFKKLTDKDGTEYWATPLLNGLGYYDINKDFNEDSDKCSGAVAANMFHYWFDRNRGNIDRFLKQFPEENGVIKIAGETIRLSEFLETYHSNDNGDVTYRDKSPFFDYISKNFRGPVWTDKLLDAWINGYGYNHKWGRNIEDASKNTSGINFFKKVFNEKLLTDVHQIFNHDTLSYWLRDGLYTGKAIGLSYGPAGLRHSLGHIISIWGADFDEQHRVVAIYVTDSDDKQLTVGESGPRIGLKRYRVFSDDQGRARLTAYAKDNTDGEAKDNAGGEVREVYTLDMGRQGWENYFNSKPQ